MQIKYYTYYNNHIMLLICYKIHIAYDLVGLKFIEYSFNENAAIS